MTDLEFDSALENLRGYSRWAGKPTVLEIAADELERMRAALKWYADGQHFDKADPDAWDTVSGEPQHWWCDEAGTATVEDGSIAEMALRGEITAAQIQALGGDDDQAFDRNAERITREAMGADVDRPINMHATTVDNL